MHVHKRRQAGIYKHLYCQYCVCVSESKRDLLQTEVYWLTPKLTHPDTFLSLVLCHHHCFIVSLCRRPSFHTFTQLQILAPFATIVLYSCVLTNEVMQHDFVLASRDLGQSDFYTKRRIVSLYLVQL